MRNYEKLLYAFYDRRFQPEEYEPYPLEEPFDPFPDHFPGTTTAPMQGQYLAIQSGHPHIPGQYPQPQPQYLPPNPNIPPHQIPGQMPQSFPPHWPPNMPSPQAPVPTPTPTTWDFVKVIWDQAVADGIKKRDEENAKLASLAQMRYLQQPPFGPMDSGAPYEGIPLALPLHPIHPMPPMPPMPPAHPFPGTGMGYQQFPGMWI
ncbi:hypothetical protein ABW19_dt0200911 [Dactylella cylindrospora]|nr:hypothetical protein ABW19_dt0200911 [Dactylella cylindrospora]